ncbi:hypothetical protein B0H10DRAFT_2084617 [Mycena sp. CBHHK59/15]|nr:hypothetical protein B0H10DRAFT_2084617 [Mycena sp. CBHHK59/15]
MHAIKGVLKAITPHTLPALIMSAPTVQGFLLALQNGGNSVQLITITVIVSGDGGIHLDVRPANAHNHHPRDLTIVDVGLSAPTSIGRSADATSTSFPSLRIDPRAASAINIDANSSFAVASSSNGPHRTITASTWTDLSTPPPPYSSTPLSSPSAPQNNALHSSVPLPPNSAIDPMVPIIINTRTRLRTRALAEPRTRLHLPPAASALPAQSPGLLAALVVAGLEMLGAQAKRGFWSVDTEEGGRNVKRRRL